MTHEAGTLVPCAAHPGVQTGLRCSKCEKPICPRCLVQTPVGARCRDCAQLRRLPTFDLKPSLFLRAVGAGVTAAVVTGFIWGSLPTMGFLSIFLGGIAGYLIGEAVGRGANRRRSVWLKVLAATCVVLAFVVSELGSPFIRAIPVMGSVGFGTVALLLLDGLLRALFNPFALLMVALGAFIATRRID